MAIEALYSRAKRGDTDAESHLFELLTVRFRLFAYHTMGDVEEANDAVQSAMANIIIGFREKRFSAGFSAWAYAVLKHEIYNQTRKGRRRKKLLAQHADDVSAGSFRPDPDLELRLSQCLRQLIRFYPRYARVLNLRYQGYDVKEICRKLQITRANLYVLHSRARTALKSCLETGVVDK